MIDKDNILIVSNHHRRSFLFENSMIRLHDAGYHNIWIQDTGSEALGKYSGPHSKYWTIGSTSYDVGMTNIHKESRNTNFKYIIFIDNDCFLTGNSFFEDYLSSFIRDKYDFCSYHVKKECYTSEYNYTDSVISEVKNQKILPSDVYPYVIPEPHWENAYMIMNMEMYQRLTDDDVGHGRKWIAALVREKAKIGAIEADYKWNYSHYGKEWFHIGNLMSFIYKMEQNKPFNKSDKLAMSRLGYMFSMGEKFSYFDRLPKDKLLSITPDNDMSYPLEVWNELVENTCME